MNLEAASQPLRPTARRPRRSPWPDGSHDCTQAEHDSDYSDGARSAGGDMTTVVLKVVPPALPKLNITIPTADSQWTTGSGTVALRGRATDNVTRVASRSDSGAEGVAAGSGAWAIADVAPQMAVTPGRPQQSSQRLAGLE